MDLLLGIRCVSLCLRSQDLDLVVLLIEVDGLHLRISAYLDSILVLHADTDIPIRLNLISVLVQNRDVKHPDRGVINTGLNIIRRFLLSILLYRFRRLIQLLLELLRILIELLYVELGVLRDLIVLRDTDLNGIVLALVGEFPFQEVCLLFCRRDRVAKGLAVYDAGVGDPGLSLCHAEAGVRELYVLLCHLHCLCSLGHLPGSLCKICLLIKGQCEHGIRLGFADLAVLVGDGDRGKAAVGQLDRIGIDDAGIGPDVVEESLPHRLSGDGCDLEK